MLHVDTTNRSNSASSSGSDDSDDSSTLVELRGKRDCPDSFEDVLRTAPPIVVLRRWTELPGFIESVTEEHLVEKRKQLFWWNQAYWRNATRALDDAIDRGVRSK